MQASLNRPWDYYALVTLFSFLLKVGLISKAGWRSAYAQTHARLNL